MNLVELFAFTIAIFLGLHFCFLYKGNRKANIWLGILLIQMSLGYIDLAEQVLIIPDLVLNVISVIASPFTFAVVILYYFFSISRTERKVERKYRWVLTPIVLDLTLRVSGMFVVDEYGSAAVFFSVMDDLFAILELVFAVGTMVIILLLIRGHNRSIRNYFSSLEHKQLNWLRILLYINLSFFAIWVIDDGLRHMIGDNLVSEIISIISLFATLLNVLWIGFSSLRQPPIFDENERIDEELVVVEQKPELETADRLLFESLDERIRQNQYFLNSSITLRELAELLEVRDKELSRIINRYSSDSFYGYINALRVDHFKQILKNETHANLSILGMAMESGFKNKSTFYSAFRKAEGMTPREYQSKLSSM